MLKYRSVVTTNKLSAVLAPHIVYLAPRTEDIDAELLGQGTHSESSFQSALVQNPLTWITPSKLKEGSLLIQNRLAVIENVDSTSERQTAWGQLEVVLITGIAITFVFTAKIS